MTQLNQTPQHADPTTNQVTENAQSSVTTSPNRAVAASRRPRSGWKTGIRAGNGEVEAVEGDNDPEGQQ